MVTVVARLDRGRMISTGTGVVVGASGLVLTNEHVVAGASRVNVLVAGHPVAEAVRVVADDAVHDLALLEVADAGDLPAIPLGPPAGPSPSDPVEVLGAAFGRPGSFRVSATVVEVGQAIVGRNPATGSSEVLTGLVEIDADLPPGTSGAPVLGAAGQLVALGVAGVGPTTGFPRGLGFAIPVEQIASFLARCGRLPAAALAGSAVPGRLLAP